MLVSKVPFLYDNFFIWYSKLFLTETVIPDTECNGTANAFRILLAKTALGNEIPQIFPKIHLTTNEIKNAKELIDNSGMPILSAVEFQEAADQVKAALS